MKATRSSIEKTTEIISTFVEELRSRPTTNVPILSKYDVLLTSLKETPECKTSPFIDVMLPFTVSLYPQHLGTIKESVQEIIDSYLLTSYVHGGFQGIIMCYKNFALPEKNKITFDSGIVTVRLQLECIVFYPTINTYLIGQISQQSHDHIALLLFGIFNVKVNSELVRERLLKKIEENTMVRFKIRGMNFNHNPPIIEGDMTDAQSKVIRVE